jgi:PAS domain-containing protein
MGEKGSLGLLRWKIKSSSVLRSEEALRKSEERFRLAAQAAKMYAYEWDVLTDKIVRSEEFVNVLGYSS